VWILHAMAQAREVLLLRSKNQVAEILERFPGVGRHFFLWIERKPDYGIICHGNSGCRIESSISGEPFSRALRLLSWKLQFVLQSQCHLRQQIGERGAISLIVSQGFSLALESGLHLAVRFVDFVKQRLGLIEDSGAQITLGGR